MDDPAKTHPVHATLEQIDSLAKSSQLSDLNTEIDDTRRQALDRIFFVVGDARKRVTRLKGVRANLSVFSNINNSAQAVKQELEHYISNKNLALMRLIKQIRAWHCISPNFQPDRLLLRQKRRSKDSESRLALR